MAVSIGGIALLSYAILTFLNPTLNDYQRAILTSVAEHHADMLASTDRRAIEREAAQLTTAFVAVHYDPRRLDAGEIQKSHPLLGSSLIHHHESEGRTLTEKLTISKEHALRQVTATREAMRSGMLVNLTAHTRLHSYGMWSYFSTCLDMKSFSYIGMAGRFYERTDDDCPSMGAPK